jgi:hypothetical protein
VEEKSTRGLDSHCNRGRDSSMGGSKQVMLDLTGAPKKPGLDEMPKTRKSRIDGRSK